MRPFVIDTDPGIDDALALLFAFGVPDVAVVALTTVAGNVEVHIGTANARRIVEVARPAAPPVIARGAGAPLARPLRTAVGFHGDDGLGGAAGPGTDAGDGPAGPDVLVEMARRHGSALTLVALGPLTNLALALERDGRALAQVGRLVVMGGAVDVPGNVTPDAEFNFHVDPEAARRVLGAGLPVELVPLDVTRQVVLTRERLDAALATAPAALGRFVTDMTRWVFRTDQGCTDARTMSLHDPLAVGVATDLAAVEMEDVCVSVGPDGETRRAIGPPNCRVAVRVDAERFLVTFLERLCLASS
jgi:inosine-uridine nucleoside N-ribohydrolase